MTLVLKRMRCVYCNNLLSRKTVRRHTAPFGGCNAREREARRKDTATQRLLNPDLTLEAERGRPKGRRPFSHRFPPASPPPFGSTPRSAARRPNPPLATALSGNNGVRGDNSTINTDLARDPPNPALEEFDALSQALPLHPELQFKTSGAGPSCLDNPLDRPGDVPPHPITNNPADPGVTLGEAEPWLRGLTAWQRVQNELVAELALRGFNYKIDTGITARAYSKLPRAFPTLEDLPTELVMRKRVAVLAGVQGVRIDMCVKSCIAFTDKYEHYRECTHCGKPRYETDPSNPDLERPVRTFLYIPLIPRLINLFRDKAMAAKLGYRGRYQLRPGIIRDIFDGLHYQRLRGRRVWTFKRNFSHHYFSMPTDIALGLSTDGFGPFKSSQQSCWPLLIFNYNLPPSIRFQLENVLCLGVIPDLAAGVPAWDGENERTFCLRVYLIVCFGDIPVVAKLMCMKGPGAKQPCRACKLAAIKHPDSTKYYTCLTRPFADNPSPYDLLNLPRRTHAEYVRQAVDVERSNTDTRKTERSKQFGVSGLSALADVPSLQFLESFPHDFMHAVFENVLVTLVNLWTGRGKFSDFGTGREEYRLKPGVWDAIGAACASSGDTIPSIFGCRVPNLAEKKRHVTAEACMLFATLIGPAFLYRQFTRQCYYDHFVQLIRLIRQCLQLEITEAALHEIRTGFADWVQEYERMYYRYKADRLMACTLPIHSLLHIADDILTMGPVCISKPGF
ncbi:Transposase family tnp2 [Ceratobasidium sp. AG-Ba]|nr:Transposase family tnp2 [Ceratobasidium sp. AG-Ba]